LKDAPAQILVSNAAKVFDGDYSNTSHLKMLCQCDVVQLYARLRRGADAGEICRRLHSLEAHERVNLRAQAAQQQGSCSVTRFCYTGDNHKSVNSLISRDFGGAKRSSPRLHQPFITPAKSSAVFGGKRIFSPKLAMLCS
jgi:hypothetical protein